MQQDAAAIYSILGTKRHLGNFGITCTVLNGGIAHEFSIQRIPLHRFRVNGEMINLCEYCLEKFYGFVY